MLFRSIQDSEVMKQINKVKAIGVEGVKLCGAGGSGFFLLIDKPEIINQVKNRIEPSLIVEVAIVNDGLKIEKF